jgi:hypothetical protein
MKELLQKYADLKASVKEAEEKIDELSVEIRAKMTEQGADKIDAENLGIFTIAKKKSWKYSERVEAATESLNMMKKDEQACGTATFVEDPYLVFKPLKKDIE